MSSNFKFDSNDGSMGYDGSKPIHPSASPNPFDLKALRLSTDSTDGVSVRKVLTNIPVRKPAKEWFVRCHPDPNYRISTRVIELKEEGETYWVPPPFFEQLSGESTFCPKTLITAVNKQGVLFIWPLRLPGPDGRDDNWSRSAREAASIATEKWVRVRSNMSLGGYEIFEATGNLSAPEWPDMSFEDILRIAFKNRKIDSVDHPMLKRLRGEI